MTIIARFFEIFIQLWSTKRLKGDIFTQNEEKTTSLQKKGEGMGCRVGITTDLETRRKHWESQYYGFSGWTVVSTHYSKSAAQAKESEKARQHGCVSHPGGSGPEKATWYVYHFNFTRKK